MTEKSPTFAVIPLTVTAAQITNLMISFIESGDPVTRGWCEGVFLETPGTWERDTITRAGAPIWYAQAGLWAADDWMIRVLEDEDETGDPDQCKAHLISKKEFIAGLTALATAENGAYSKHFNDIVSENDDAATADILMQFILFGKEVYA